jgi:CheY-like chemotaxis protein
MPHKLLLADDSVTIQRVIELTFADEDVQVLAVGDGKQAIARVQSDRPDIVLADVGMPERNGYEVAAFIKGDPELAHIPVLLLTGAFEPIDEARAQAVGCDGVLVKPFEPQMVINRVKDLLAGRRPQGSWSSSPAAQTPVRQAAPVAAQAQGGDFDLRAAAPQQQPAASGSLEDYFDRLDAAFASLDAGAPPASSSGAASAPPEQFAATAPPSAAQGFSPIDDLAGWDPDLIGDPAKPVALDASPANTEPLRAIVPPPAYAPPAAPAPPVSMPAAPAAFAPTPAPPSPTPAPPSPTPAPPSASVASLPSLAEAFAALLTVEQGQPVAPSKVRPGMLSDEVIDDIVRRVTERMSDRAVRDTVADVAERLVREEIARLKGA